MACGAAKLDWDRTAALWCLLANVNRDPNDKPEPYLPSDIHPLRTRDEYQQAEDGEPDTRMLNRIFQQVPVTPIDLGKLNGYQSD